MSSLKDRVTEDMKNAMRAKDSERLGTIRMITSAIKQREVDERITLDDAQVLSVIEKMIKTRKESIAQFQSGGREDLVAKEQKEIDLLQAYMPEQLSEADLDKLIADVRKSARYELTIRHDLSQADVDRAHTLANPTGQEAAMPMILQVTIHRW